MGFLDTLDSIARGLGWFVLLVSVIPFLFINIFNIFAINYKATVALGVSELPKIPPGSIIVIQKTEYLKKGDIGCYIIPSDSCSPNPAIARKGDVVCHDVIDVEVRGREIYYKFKGANNPEPDPCLINKRYVVGKVVAVIPYAGIGVIPWEIYVRLLFHIASGGYL